MAVPGKKHWETPLGSIFLFLMAFFYGQSNRDLNQNLEQKGKIAMPKGQVKRFNEEKGYGFIQQNGGNDLFVHYTSIQGDGFKSLKEGQRVRFEIEEMPKGRSAKNVQTI